MLQKITDKLRHLAAHAKNKGLCNFIAAKAYDTFIKMRLRNAGINFSHTKGQQVAATAISVNKDAHENQASSYYDIKMSIAFLPFDVSKINLLDIGCGSGRVLNYAMLCNVNAVTGIDLDEEALQLAAQNCETVKKKGSTTSFTIAKADATLFDIPEPVNTVYMFNPFGLQTMQAVLQNIFRHVKVTNRPLYLIYCMPAYKAVFEASSNCRKIFEDFNKSGTISELCIYAINP
jgi:2-polyprenyl-3-methyl-5-hydroxy-6-metoxy-1,4-benzoquinol methylase